MSLKLLLSADVNSPKPTDGLAFIVLRACFFWPSAAALLGSGYCELRKASRATTTATKSAAAWRNFSPSFASSPAQGLCVFALYKMVAG